MIEQLLDALLESLVILGVVFILNIFLSFIESRIANSLAKNPKLSPVLGASIGLIPQCGFSIVASDMYYKKKISMGTIIAVFIACSDEALPMIIATPSKIKYLLPLLIVKFVVGLFIGLLVDFIISRKKVYNELINTSSIDEDSTIHHGCCNHTIENKHHSHKSKINTHLLHPLIHSLKIFAYVLLVNVIFAVIFYYVKEDVISNFLITNKWLTPLFSVIIGLIPNCASSVIITELFIKESISFAATIAGLICNAGLGLIFLFKNNKNIKNNFIILGILISAGLLVGYITLLFETLF